MKKLFSPFSTLKKASISITILGYAFVALVIVGASVAAMPAHIQAQETTEQRETRLKAELAKVEQEQRETEAVLRSTQAQSASFQRDISILDTKIKAAQLNIKAKNLLIETLGKDITKKDATIRTLNERIDRGQESLAQIIRKTYESDNDSVPEILLSGQGVAKALADIDSFQSVEQALAVTFSEIRGTKTQTETEKTTLNKRRAQETDARKIIEQEQANIKVAQADKQKLLGLSKSSEKTYESVLAEKRAKAAQIRAALFSLRDTAAIPFAKALEYANAASKATGVRPAFILAILQQESAWGANVGSCYLTNQETGAGVGARTGNAIANVMKPTRDVAPFIAITAELGIDWTKQVVSCPQSIGYGGAMGPAQFIPSTWLMFKDRIAQALGKTTSNPWIAQDAFTASSLYLSDLGAKAGSFSAERDAACRYYSGRACDPLSINSTYGNQVMSKAYNIQETMINPLQGL